MIIADPEDPYADEYDEEYVLTISDWYVAFYSSYNAMLSSPSPGSMTSLSNWGKNCSTR